MRVLPYFLGAATLVAIGGAAAGGAIDTTPRKIFDSAAPIPSGSGITFDNNRRDMPAANHYPLETGDERYDVAELRERGLYSQKRYAQSYYQDDFGGDQDEFDYAAATADQRRWEAEQQRVGQAPRVAYQESRPLPERSREVEKPANTNKPAIKFVSRPVVQDTSGMTRR